MIRQSQQQEGQFASFEDTAAHLPEPFVAESRGRSRGNRSGPIGNQTEKFHPYGVRRLCLAIVNRAILDVLENGNQSREAERWLLSRDFERLQTAFD
jgi:hypothetical protein